MFDTPETLAGVPMPVLNRPETVSPMFSRPDCSEPTFLKPDTAEVPKFWKPEMSPPKFAIPDTVPVPPLKKPDDGLLVELNKPVTAGMSKMVQSTGPRLVVAGIDTTVVPLGSPMLNEIAGPVAVIGARVTESIVPVKTGSGPIATVKPKLMSSIVIPLYSVLVKLAVSGMLMGALASTCAGISGTWMT